jgi:hypothetical protein
MSLTSFVRIDLFKIIKLGQVWSRGSRVVNYASCMLHRCFKYYSNLLHVYFKYASSVHQVCLKHDSCMLQVCIKYQGWAIPGSAHQYYTQYYTGQKLLSNTNTQYKYYTKSQSTIQARHSSVSACLSD